MKKLVFILSVMAVISGCSKWLDPNASFKNALIIKPAASTKADNGILSTDGATIYTIGSAFIGGGMPYPHFAAKRYSFYQKQFDKYPGFEEESLLVFIHGHGDPADYKDEECIDRITIRGIDESLGLGTNILISMEKGKYNGGNPLIKDVQIKSFKMSSVTDGVKNPDANINIVITTTTGAVLTISYVDAATLYDGLE